MAKWLGFEGFGLWSVARQCEATAGNMRYQKDSKHWRGEAVYLYIREAAALHSKSLNQQL